MAAFVPEGTVEQRAGARRPQTACAHQAGQHLDDGGNAAIDIDRQRKLVGDDQALEPLAVGAMIDHTTSGPPRSVYAVAAEQPARRFFGRSRGASGLSPPPQPMRPARTHAAAVASEKMRMRRSPYRGYCVDSSFIRGTTGASFSALRPW